MDKAKKLEQRLKALQNTYDQTEQEITLLGEKENELERGNVEKLKTGEPIIEVNSFGEKKKNKAAFLIEVETAIREVKKDLIKAKLDKLDKEEAKENKVLEKLNLEIERIKKSLNEAELNYRKRDQLNVIYFEREELQKQLGELEPKKEEPGPFDPDQLPRYPNYRELKEKRRLKARAEDERIIGTIGEIEDKHGFKRWGFKLRKQ